MAKQPPIKFIPPRYHHFASGFCFLTQAAIFVANNYMMMKLLPVFLFLTVYTAQARDLSLADGSTTDNLYHLTTPKLPSSRGYGGGVRVLSAFAIEGGYGAVNAKGSTPADTYNKGGFLYVVSLGAKIYLAPKTDVAQNVISVMASYSNWAFNKLSLNYIGLPVNYTHMHFGRGGAGTYWQLGVTPNYNYLIKDGSDNKITSKFTTVVFEPMIGLGLHGPFLIIDRRGAATGRGRVFAGLWASYLANNIANYPGETMKGFKIGIKYDYVI
jgi:hypothetical protein